MNVGSITAVCAIVIATASLAISVLEARAAREHDRKSVMPVLRVTRVATHGDTWAGLTLKNAGLGPAVITDTIIQLDGKVVGRWDRGTLALMAGSNEPIPNFSALYEATVIPAGTEQRLIFLSNFDDERDAWFWDLIAFRLDIEIRYESIYGGEAFSAAKHPRVS
jgi:hypothetical protein